MTYRAIMKGTWLLSSNTNHGDKRSTDEPSDVGRAADATAAPANGP
jgi:hypothetical protein